MKKSKTFIDMDKFAKSLNELVMCNEKPMKIKQRSKERVHKWFAEYYANWHEDLSKNFLSLLNATFSGGRTIVGLNRVRMANIVANDPNYKKEDSDTKEEGKVITRSMTERHYTDLLLYLQEAEGDERFFEIIRRSEKGKKGSAMILKLIHPELRAFMEITPELEDKWGEESKDFRRKKSKRKPQQSEDSADAQSSAGPENSSNSEGKDEPSDKEQSANNASGLCFKILTQEEIALIDGIIERIPKQFHRSLYLTKSNMKNKWPKHFLEEAGALSKLTQYEVVLFIRYIIIDLCTQLEQERVFGYCAQSYLRGLTKSEVQHR